MTTAVADAHSQQIAPTPGATPLATLFDRLAAAGIDYCLLRGLDEIRDGSADDVDLLVAADDLPRLRTLLARLGFAPLARPGHLPHHFFLGFDEDRERWVKLDVVTEITYGRPVPVLRTGLEVGCLRDRMRCGDVFMPSPPDEFATLLLHCLLDRQDFTPVNRSRLTALAAAIGDERAVAARLAGCCPDLARSAPVGMVAAGRWQALLASAAGLAGQLAGHGPAGMRWRRLRTRAVRFVERRTRCLRERGLMVALLAPDGAGKTTLARGMHKTFHLPTRAIYMGTNPASSTLTLPTTRWLARASGPRQGRVVSALAAVNATIEQGVRYRVGAYHRWRGRLVIFDRYPPDALARGERGGPRRKQWRRALLRALCPAPDLVIYLDAPSEVLFRRKQDHRPDVLEKLRRRDLHLVRESGRGLVVDARRDRDAVRRAVVAAIWHHYARREGGSR